MSSATAYLLYAVFALGGVGVYLALPKGDQTKLLAGSVMGVLSLVALLIVLIVRGLAPAAHGAYFVLFSTVAIAAAFRVITHPKPVYCVVYFVLVALAVAAMLVVQQAEFLAVGVVLVYAGAIIVTYVFVIMLAQQEGTATYDVHAREPFAAVLAGFVLMAAIAAQAGDLPAPRSVKGPTVALAADRPADVHTAETSPAHVPSNTRSMGWQLAGRYAVVLQVAGVLLLVSMVGAVALSRKTMPSDVVQYPRRPLGQAGREAEPY